MLSQLAEEWPRFATYYNLLFIGKAALTTLALSAAGCIVGSLLGLALAIVRLTSARWLLPLRVIAIGFTELFRRVPFLVTLMLCFFAFQATGADVPLFVVAAVTVTLIAAAFLSEIVRGGFNAVHPNQWEAAAAMNFSLLETIRYVVLPQAWRIILPPAFGFFVMFIKDTALASAVAAPELMFRARTLVDKTFLAPQIFVTAAAIYLVMSLPLGHLTRWAEARVARGRR